METTNRAFFVDRPSMLADLAIPHPAENEQTFSITKRVNLRYSDYENFVTDLLVERDYIAQFSALCVNKDDVLDCLFISHPNTDEGVLVIPDENGFVERAAVLKESPNYNVNLNYPRIRGGAPRRFQSRRQRR